ncbi:MAG TPA: hypothetical protein V6D47_18210, partial [Oscillatoriaceae cyanobacterium]
LSIMGQGALGEMDFSWQVYVDKAAEDPSWSLDDLLLPVLQFLQTEDGVLFLIKLMDQRALMLGANGEAIASIGVALKGREVSPQLIDALMGALGNVLRHDEISLQPLIERASGFLSTPDGQGWFYAMGEYLAQHRDGLNAQFGDVLALAAQHPHLDIAPLVREFVALVMKPQGRAWQEVLLNWVDHDGQKREGFIKALQPLLADGRLQLGELALPAVGFLFSKEGAPLRGEVLTSLRTRIRGVDLGGMAQGLWRAAGNAVQQALNPAAKPAP